MYEYFTCCSSTHSHICANPLLSQDEIAHALKSSLQAINLSEAGVYVQASTLGSLEALLDYLAGVKVAVRSRCARVTSLSCACVECYCFITFEFNSLRSGRSNIRTVRVHSRNLVFPLQYSGVNIGPIHKSDVMKASVMLEKDRQCALNPLLIAIYLKATLLSVLQYS